MNAFGEGVAGRNGPQWRVPEDGSSIAGWSREETSSLKAAFCVASWVVSYCVRIVLDTASFVTAVRSSDGAAGEVVRMIFREELVPLMDLKLGLEYRDVALRSEHVRASALNKREILELIEAVEAFAEPVEVVVKTRPLSSDPSDDMILDIAINGQGRGAGYEQQETLCGGRKEVWNSGAFPGRTVRENEEGELRWRLKRARLRFQNFRCG